MQYDMKKTDGKRWNGLHYGVFIAFRIRLSESFYFLPHKTSIA